MESVRSRLEPEVIEQGRLIAEGIIESIRRWGEVEGPLKLPERVTLNDEDYAAVAQFMIDSGRLTYSDVRDGKLHVGGLPVGIWLGFSMGQHA